MSLPVTRMFTERLSEMSERDSNRKRRFLFRDSAINLISIFPVFFSIFRRFGKRKIMQVSAQPVKIISFPLVKRLKMDVVYHEQYEKFIKTNALLSVKHFI